MRVNMSAMGSVSMSPHQLAFTTPGNLALERQLRQTDAGTSERR
jgi:hypothetical protein